MSYFSPDSRSYYSTASHYSHTTSTYYNDVYRLEEQKAEQQKVIEQLQEALA